MGGRPCSASAWVTRSSGSRGRPHVQAQFGHVEAISPCEPPGRAGELSSHNHGFAVAPDSRRPAVIPRESTQDECLEGLAAPDLWASPSSTTPRQRPVPTSAAWFDAFIAAMADFRDRE